LGGKRQISNQDDHLTDMAKLIFKLDDGQEIVVALSEKITIGRVEGNDVVVDDRRISSKHAVITRSAEGQFEVEDLGSKGGTFLNGSRIKKSLVNDGDEIGFGPLHGRLILDSEDKATTKPLSLPAPPAAAVPSKKTAPIPLPVQEAAVAATRDADLSSPQAAEAISQKLLERLTHLQKDLAATESTLHQLQAQKMEAREALEQLVTQREESESLVHDQTSALAKLRHEANLTEARVKEMTSQVQAATEELEAKTARLATLEEQESHLNTVTAAVADATERKVALELGITALSNQYGESVTSLDELRKELTSTTEQKTSLLSLVDGITSELAVLEPKLADTKRHCTEFEEKAETLQALIAKREGEGKVLEEKLQSLEQESVGLQSRIEKLGGTEEQLLKVQAEVRETESNHARLSELLLALTVTHGAEETRLSTLRAEIAVVEGRHAEVTAQLAASQAALTEAESKLSAYETGAESRRLELDAAETALEKELEARRKELDAERVSLESALETRRQELDAEKTGAEAALEARRKELESEKAAAEAALEARRKELDAERVAAEAELETRRKDLHEDKTTLEAALDVRRQEVHQEKATLSAQLASLHQEIADEETRLGTSKTEREKLTLQCQELADTGTKLHEARLHLDQTRTRNEELTAANKAMDAQHVELENTFAALTESHENLLGRMEVLRGREHDLRQELEILSEREEKDRSRFEELSKLNSDAEKEYSERAAQIARSLAVSTRELEDLELKLTPLREWKEEMDKRYERLAALPEDSEEARELWREIESEKKSLTNLMSARREGDTRGITLNSDVLRGIGRSGGESSGGFKNADGEPPEDKRSFGHMGTGAMLSGTGQEMALKARVTRLRESVQREATRLEFLRQERAREEARKANGGNHEPMLREQERQLEVKIRREEEHLATIQRKLEVAGVEEEKRREKIAELEHKLNELKSDIAEADRDRHDARHHADVAKVDHAHHEENVTTDESDLPASDRARSGGKPSSFGGGVLASIINSTKAKAGLNLKPMGKPKDK